MLLLMAVTGCLVIISKELIIYHTLEKLQTILPRGLFTELHSQGPIYIEVNTIFT